MVVVENFPLFRTKTPVAAVGVVAEAPGPAPEQPETETFTDNDFTPIDYTDLPYGDLTHWVGHTVDADTLGELEAEAYRRYAGGFVFNAKQVADGWKVTRFGAPTDEQPKAHKPPLPVEQWVTGITTLTEAQAVRRNLSQTWRTSLSKQTEAYHVRCPGWQAIVERDEVTI